MIIVKIFGGLGNQMFQYAAARRLAINNDELLKLAVDYQNQLDGPVAHRNYCLRHFNIKAQIATAEEINDLKKRHFVREKHFRFDPEILRLNRDVYLEGYWASEKYFKDIEKVVKDELTVKYPLTDLNLHYTELINNRESVALHVRRGDYLALNHVYPLCPLSYYDEAAKRLAEQFGDLHFFVFSDDPVWVKHNLNLSFPNTVIEHNGEDYNYEDLRLMSLCHHHIIANSTFSWWGAWLAAWPDKTVFSPSKWFVAADYSDLSDLLPESWYQI